MMAAAPMRLKEAMAIFRAMFREETTGERLIFIGMDRSEIVRR